MCLSVPRRMSLRLSLRRGNFTRGIACRGCEKSTSASNAKEPCGLLVFCKDTPSSWFSKGNQKRTEAILGPKIPLLGGFERDTKRNTHYYFLFWVGGGGGGSLNTHTRTRTHTHTHTHVPRKMSCGNCFRRIYALDQHLEAEDWVTEDRVQSTDRCGFLWGRILPARPNCSDSCSGISPMAKL